MIDEGKKPEEPDNSSEHAQGDIHLGLKDLIFVAFAIALVLSLFNWIVKPALEPTSHAPTTVIDAAEDDGYWRSFFDVQE
jgi:hypothetical protein